MSTEENKKEEIEEQEIWAVYKDTRGSKGSLWELSTFGRIKRNGEDFTPRITNNGYYYFGGYFLHRALAELFIPNPLSKPTVDHIDRDKSNNHVSNLRWATLSEQNKNRNAMTEEWRRNLSESKKGEKNPMYGRRHSEETRKKLSEAKKGERHPMFGRHFSEESRKKISDKLTGHKISEESRQKMRESQKRAWARRKAQS